MRSCGIMHFNRTLALQACSASIISAFNLTESYAPVYVDCPADVNFVRSAGQGLNPSEETWLHNRKKVVAGALPMYLSNAKLEDFDMDCYMSGLKNSNYDAVPGIGVAVSGGGYASLLEGSGVLRALDGREKVANSAGTGGLLQALSFVSGQSGGSWLVSTYAAAGFPLSEDLLEYWQPQINRFNATTDGTHAATLKSIVLDIAAKYKAGFNVSVGDFIGRIQSYEFIHGPRGGLNVTLSGIKNLQKFKEHDMPLPIIQISQVTKKDPNEHGLYVPTFKSPIYEMTPYEFGSWMEPIDSFTDMEYIGTTMMDGKPANKSACVRGYDRISWAMGSSANAYEFWWLENHSNDTLGQFPKRSAEAGGHQSRQVSRIERNMLTKRFNPEFPNNFVEELGKPFTEIFKLDLDQYVYTRVPNPFRNQSTNPQDDELLMVDATETASALPLAGQLARNASFIMAWDDSSDAYTNGWQNGTDMYQSYLYFKEHNIPFPIVPSPSTFIARNWTVKPQFFGCDARLTTTNDTRAPIVAWFSNAPYSSYTNITYFQNVTPFSRVHDIWNNTFNEITQGAGSLDPEWSACLACAAIDRSLEKISPPMQRTAQCQRCFDKYCWDGTSEPDYPDFQDVNPTLALHPEVTYAEWYETVGSKFH